MSKVLRSLPTFRIYLMTEVLIGGVQGPIGAEVPDDVVRNGPPNQSTLGQEKQVHSGLPVALKDLANVHPFLQGIRSNLYALPIIGESLEEELEALMFKVLPTRYLHMRQPAQCGQCQCRRLEVVVWSGRSSGPSGSSS